MKVNIGKNTLGDNDKMSVSLREYDRSTHDLSFAWRSTMGVGTLVPCLKLLGTAGDTFTIEAEEKIMTHPTLGPLLGSFKFQCDIFSVPIRLYNAMLHNNALNIGLDMSKVKLPKLVVNTDAKTPSSSIFNYLGIKKFKSGKKYNAVPWLGVMDIFKNYYANKQEELYYMLKNETTENNVAIVNGENILGVMENATDGTIEQKDVVIKITTGISADTINKGNSYLDLQPRSWTEGSGITQYMRGRVPLSGCELEYDGRTLSIKVANGAGFSLQGGQSTNPNAEITFNGGTATIFSNNDIIMQSFKLEELDTLREDILSKGRQEYIIGGSGANCKVTSLNELVKGIIVSGELYGLPLKTHFSDIFNNWVNKEWIEGDNGITALTAIDTSSGSFTIDTLNLSQKVYNLLNRIAISGGSYKDWIETVYTTDYYFRAETPVYEGGISGEIEFGEVVSTSATEIQGNEPLGTLAGKGYNSNKKGGTVTIKLSEPSYIIGIASITPRVDYSQGNDWDNDLDTLNDIHKPQLDGIGYQDLLEKWMHADTNDDAAVGKTVAWINYMTNVNKTYGNFAAGESEGFMCLNRQYEVKAGEIQNVTTYINPKEFTGIFATNEITNQDFWVQLGFRINARRVMSAKQIPMM